MIQKGPLFKQGVALFASLRSEKSLSPTIQRLLLAGASIYTRVRPDAPIFAPLA